MGVKGNRFVVKIRTSVENISPIMIGSDEGEILVNKSDNKPYLPSTSIAGAFRAYITENISLMKADTFFGSHDTGNSKIYIYDAVANQFVIEKRPSLKINAKTGTGEDGYKFDRTFLANGHRFELNFVLFAKDETEKDEITKSLYLCLKALKQQHIRFGSYKTSGAGLFNVLNVEESTFDVNTCDGLFSYLLEKDIWQDVSHAVEQTNLTDQYVELQLTGRILEDSPLLIKGNSNFDSNLPDSENIRNSKGDYIIPGTSIKGLLRGHCRKILRYFHANPLLDEVFGSESDEKFEENLKIGRVYTRDVVIENSKDNTTYNRIRIDKFTGGTINGEQLDEKPILGDVSICVFVKLQGNETDDAIIGLILFAFRDLAVGNIAIGSGSNVGRGRLGGKKLTITRGEEIAWLDIEQKTSENMEIMEAFIQALQSYSKKEAIA